jgi:hypothetical protein
MNIGALPTPRVTFHNRGFRRGAGDTLQPEDTMADNDFVARLRIRWETMGDMANDERAAAAAEIESLRHGQREMMRTIATLTTERDGARRRTNSILTEIDCRIEHGAESNGHLEAIRSLFKENTDA